MRLRDGLFGTVRLGSTIAEGTAETLVSSSNGLEQVLEVSYQATLEESALPLTKSPAGTGTPAEQIGFIGPGGPAASQGEGHRHRLPRRGRRLLPRDLVPHPVGNRRLPPQPGTLRRRKTLVRGDLRSCSRKQAARQPGVQARLAVPRVSSRARREHAHVAREQGPGDGLRERPVQPARDREDPARRLREGDGHAVRRQPAGLGRLAFHAVHRGVDQRGHDALHPGARHPRASGQKRRRLRRGEAGQTGHARSRRTTSISRPHFAPATSS